VKAVGTNPMVMKMGKFFKISLAALLVATAAIVILTVYAFSSPAPSLPFDPEDAERVFIQYQADEISQPFEYWILTDPDPYILEVIANASIPPIYDPIMDIWWESWVYARANETTFIYQVYEHGGVWNVEYEGRYCVIWATYCYDVCLPKYYEIHQKPPPIDDKQILTAGSTVIALSWIALGVVWVKKSKPTIVRRQNA